MKKRNVVKKNEDFNRMIKTVTPYKTPTFLIYKESTNEIYHFGISVSKKIGNAVTRNLIKRRVRSILDKKNYQNGFNCIIMVKRSVLSRTYQELESELLHAIEKLNVTKEKQNEK